MATVSNLGVIPTSLADYLDRHHANWRTAYGSELTVSSETPQGQLAGLDTEADTETDEAIVSISNMLSLDLSSKAQVDALVSLLLFERREGTASIATVTFTGIPTTSIPIGTVVRSNLGDLFDTQAAVVIGAAPGGQTNGSVDVTVQAQRDGIVRVDASTIQRLLDPLVGVTAVNNANPGTEGTDGETDTHLKRRYQDGIAIHSAGTVDAIESRFLSQDTVQSVAVQDNSTDAAVDHQGLSVDAYATAVVVRWASGTTGSLALFNAIMDTIHAPAMPRQYVVPTAVDTAIVVAISGLSVAAADGGARCGSSLRRGAFPW